MKVYLVGGAVRDELLGYPIVDRDYVVTGSTVEQMMQLGYQQVGADFPVFIHPETKQEYALARTERKSGQGYKGFEVFSSPQVTLEEDLKRRDLTINAMAKDENGIVDPYGGLADLKNKILRHVSPAFSEDPLRVLRVARFAARYKHLGFKIAPETLSLMQEMVLAGELSSLVAERQWSEISRALGEQAPAYFFQVLRDCDALAVIMPELDKLFGVPQPEQHHPEIDSGVHTLLVLEQAALLSKKPEIRFAALLHDVGKGLTAKEFWPSHHGHEAKGVALIKAMVKRIAVPNTYLDLAVKVAKYHGQCHRAFELKASTLLKLLMAIDAFRQSEKLADFLLACEADARGRRGFENSQYPQAAYVNEAFLAAKAVATKELVEKGFQGAEMGKEIAKARVRAIQLVKDAQR